MNSQEHLIAFDASRKDLGLISKRFWPEECKHKLRAIICQSSTKAFSSKSKMQQSILRLLYKLKWTLSKLTDLDSQSLISFEIHDQDLKEKMTSLEFQLLQREVEASRWRHFFITMWVSLKKSFEMTTEDFKTSKPSFSHSMLPQHKKNTMNSEKLRKTPWMIIIFCIKHYIQTPLQKLWNSKWELQARRTSIDKNSVL